MRSPRDGASGSMPQDGRRSSIRGTARQSLADDTIDDDDDDYDLNAYTVSDGFRPAYDTASRRSSAQLPGPMPHLPLRGQRQSLPRLPPPMADVSSKQQSGIANRPSSIAKPPRPHDSLTLRNDGPGATSQPGGLRVPSSLGPNNGFPSSISSASSSTAAVVGESSYNGPRGPTHPYSLYTQNTVTDDTSSEDHVPLGFSGLGDAYRRQLGPDGEESGGLIGPLGHLEELPPYSRYPVDGRQPQDDPTPAPDTNSLLRHSIDGAGGIGIATRNPEFSSTREDLTRTRSRQSTYSLYSEVSRHDINTAARVITEKSRNSKWQSRGKRKMFGVVPCWAICLVALALLLTGVVLGTVVGKLLGHHGPPSQSGGNGNGDGNDDSYSYPPSATRADIQPIPTLPPNLTPVVTGVFSLPPLDVSQAPKSCFKDSTQAQAWSCEIPYRYYQLDVEKIPHASDTNEYQLSLTAINHSDSEFIWGTQPPNVPVPKALSLVSDIFDQGRGPAWWLKVQYNKTVIVSEQDFSAGTSSKRGWLDVDPESLDFEIHRHSTKQIGAQEGDKAWICTWPNVSLELFIFPDQNVSLSSSTTSMPPGYGPTSPTSSSDYPAETAALPFAPKPAYPQVIKFVERHESTSDPECEPTCNQVQIVNGQAVDLKDGDGNPIVVVIQENATSWVERLEQYQWNRHPYKRSAGSSIGKREPLELTECGCLWLST